MSLVSIRQYAKMRGISHTAVRKAIESKRLVNSVVQSDNGKKLSLIDSEMADREWPKGIQEELQPSSIGTGGSPRPELSERDEKTSQTYAQSRAVREAYAARLAKLDFEQKSGKLVDAEEIRAKWIAVASITRTKVLGIPSKAKQRIHDLTTEQFAELDKIVRESLEDLANGVT